MYFSKVFNFQKACSIWSNAYKAQFGVNELNEKIKKLRAFDRAEISRTMTLSIYFFFINFIVESTRTDDRAKAQQLLKSLVTTQPDRLCKTCSENLLKPKAIRIGFCGSPGAGKSTLIERLGLYIVGQGHKLAVLAIDPSSKQTGGAILGDKTRMEKLAQHPSAFVRPSPTRGILGGLALNTNELTLLCESIGFDMILIETVGLGQNEIEIDNVADFITYVAPPGSGDELQGAKKGIMEITDMVAVNKYDGQFEQACKKLKIDLDHSMHFQAQRYEGWTPPVHLCSATENKNINELYNSIRSFQMRHVNDIVKKRRSQSINNMWTYIANITMNAYFSLFIRSIDYKKKI